MGLDHSLCPARTRPCAGLVVMSVPPIVGETEMSLPPDVGQSENREKGFIPGREIPSKDVNCASGIAGRTCIDSAAGEEQGWALILSARQSLGWILILIL